MDRSCECYETETKKNLDTFVNFQEIVTFKLFYHEPLLQLYRQQHCLVTDKFNGRVANSVL